MAFSDVLQVYTSRLKLHYFGNMPELIELSREAGVIVRDVPFYITWFYIT